MKIFVTCMLLVAALSPQDTAQPANTAALTVGDAGSYAIIVDAKRQGTASYRVLSGDNGGLIIQGDTQLVNLDEDIQITTSTMLSADGNPIRYQLTADVAGSTRRLDVSFDDGMARAVFFAGDVSHESLVELPLTWFLFDNNSAAHLAIIVSTFRPDMPPLEGQVFVPSTFTLADFQLTYAGPSKVHVGGEDVEAQRYRMMLANRIEVDFFVKDARLLMMSQPLDGIEFIREQ